MKYQKRKIMTAKNLHRKIQKNFPNENGLIINKIILPTDEEISKNNLEIEIPENNSKQIPNDYSYKYDRKNIDTIYMKI